MDRLKRYLKTRRQSVESALKRAMPPRSLAPAKLHAAMAYSVFAGGKRVRPILAIAAAEACGGTARKVMPAACALELIHTYSLIHDDLPCMDDDDLRRGKPTNHKVFGETLAVLAGDALLAHAFRLIGDNARVKGVKPAAVVETTRIVAEAVSSLGMVGGQAADCLAEGKRAREKDVEFIHAKKTAALIRASVLAGAVLAGAGRKARVRLARYGEKLGLLFQVVDDILNVEGDPRRLGKAAGSDAKHRKATYPAAVGLKGAKRRAAKLLGEARASLKGLGDRTRPLADLAEYVLRRTN